MNTPTTNNRFQLPRARSAVLNPELTRPDWTTGIPRDPALAWLDKNENTDPELLAVTRQVMREIPDEAICTYPESTVLYRRLARHIGLDMSHLLLCAGSDGVIRSVFEAFVSPGDAVLFTAPTFAMYSVYSKMYGATAIPIEYLRGDTGPELEAATLVEAIRIHRPKLVCLPNPDSPTGTVFSEPDLRTIIETAGDVGAVVLIDEAYHPFHDSTVAPWVDDYAHLVVARTFAKAWGLAGLRIGYAIAGTELAQLLHKVRPMYEVNTVAVFAVTRMLDHEDAMRASVARHIAGREAFRSAMQEIGLVTPKTYGNFLHVAFGPLAAAVHGALAIRVLYRRDFAEPCLKGFSRFSSGSIAQLDPIIEAIRGVASSQAGSHRP